MMPGTAASFGRFERASRPGPILEKEIADWLDAKVKDYAGKPELPFDRVSNAGTVQTYAPSPDGRRILTPRSPAGRGSLRTVYFDLGFARRLAAKHSQ